MENVTVTVTVTVAVTVALNCSCGGSIDFIDSYRRKREYFMAELATQA